MVAAALVFGSWAESRLTIIIGELRAIRENLDKLWSDRNEEDGPGTGKIADEPGDGTDT